MADGIQSTRISGFYRMTVSERWSHVPNHAGNTAARLVHGATTTQRIQRGHITSHPHDHAQEVGT